LNGTVATDQARIAKKSTQDASNAQTQDATRLTPMPKNLTPKPTPAGGMGPQASEPTAFPPWPNGAPAGDGKIIQIIPLYYTHGTSIGSSWVSDTDGGRVRTFAYSGSILSDTFMTQQGVVDVQVFRKDSPQNLPDSDVSYPTPVQAGPVSIIGAQGSRLILQSIDGTLFYFDVPTRQYVPSLTSVVSKSTPDWAKIIPENASTPVGAGKLVKPIDGFAPKGYQIENAWYEESNGVRTYVYAGEVPDKADQKLQRSTIVINVVQIDHGVIGSLFYGEYPTTTQAGPINIRDAQGSRLVLQSTNGTAFYFDVPSRQYVASLTAVVPTLPASPLATPAP